MFRLVNKYSRPFTRQKPSSTSTTRHSTCSPFASTFFSSDLLLRLPRTPVYSPQTTFSRGIGWKSRYSSINVSLSSLTSSPPASASSAFTSRSSPFTSLYSFFTSTFPLSTCPPIPLSSRPSAPRSYSSSESESESPPPSLLALPLSASCCWKLDSFYRLLSGSPSVFAAAAEDEDDDDDATARAEVSLCYCAQIHDLTPSFDSVST